MANLPERKVKIREDKDLNARNLERMIQLFDENFRQLDNRRISQASALASGASLAEVITKVNEIIASLNTSDLTLET